jgi:acyl transferase domain-containing protein/short-subunit dehydrogenase
MNRTNSSSMATVLDRQDIERWLVDDLSATLGVPAREIDRGTRFKELGLDSAAATAMIQRLAAWSGRALEVTAAWAHPNVRALAAHVATRETATSSSASQTASPTHSDSTPAMREPIAVIGIGCRFPGDADGPDEFWKLLSEGRCAVREVPESRWDLAEHFSDDPAVPGKMSTRWGGFLENVDGFDAAFFAVSPREAECMDPQQRLALELTWEALEDARIVPGQLRGTRTGVYFGAMWSDYQRIASGELSQIEQHSATGQDLSLIAGRVSYCFGLQGPSMLVNTACSSALVSVQLACQALQANEAELAVAGGVNLVLSPASTVAMSKFGAMNPDGKCRAFDAGANGYVRGEGGGVIVLKPLSKALRDGDRIYCTILGWAVNNDGPSNGLTAPNPHAQVDVLRAAYRRAGVSPERVAYVETHGPGTRLGDPIEAEALHHALCQGRTAETLLRIGSVKTNLGHLEAAAGIAGLIKVALALRHRRLPQSLHFEQPNPHIPFERWRLAVQSSAGAWPEGDTPVAGVSSFGFGGTNAHIVLQGMPQAAAYVLPLTAATGPELRLRLADTLEQLGTAEGEALQEICARAQAEAKPAARRRAFAAASGEELRAALANGLREVAPELSERGRLVWVCPGQGALPWRCGMQLFRDEPAFREALLECDRAIREAGGFSVVDLLALADGAKRLERTEFAQPAEFALQVSLGALWRARGIVPDVIVGHSMGEVGAAYLSGALSLPDAARVICARSKLAQRIAGQGALAVVGLSESAALAALAEEGSGRVSLAAHNAPKSVILSGDPGALAGLLCTLEARGVYVARTNVEFAAHSAQVEPLLADLAAELAELAPRASHTPMFSTVDVDCVDGASCDASYWCRNLRQTVQFSPAIGRLLSLGHTSFLELSAHPILQRAITERATLEGSRVSLLASLRRDEPEHLSVARSLAALFEAGYDVRFERERSDDARLFVLSARTPAALKAFAAECAAAFQRLPAATLEDVCATAALQREHHEHRLAVVASSLSELSASLLASETPAPSVLTGRARSEPRPRLAFVFSGHGSQWLGMGRELLRCAPVFRETFEKVAEAIARHSDLALVSLLHDDSSGFAQEKHEVVQPMLFAFGVALAAQFKAWGIQPDAVVGHSVGEVTAAHVAGILELEDAARIVCRRSWLMAQPGSLGSMVVVGMTLAEARELVREFPDEVSVAVSNAPTMTVLSGRTETVRRVVAEVEARGIYVKWVKVNVAAHGPLMQLPADTLRAELASLVPNAGTVPMYSTTRGEVLSGERFDADYWASNLRDTVLFSTAIESLLEDEFESFLEIGPHPILSTFIEQVCEAKQARANVITCLKREESERRMLLLGLGALHLAGHAPDFAAVFPKQYRAVQFPRYSWQRKRYWPVQPARRELASSTPTAAGLLLGRAIESAVEPSLQLYQTALDPNRSQFLRDHRVRDVMLLSGSTLLELSWLAARERFGAADLEVSGMQFELPVTLDERTGRSLQLALAPEAESCGITFYGRDTGGGNWIRHAASRIAPAASRGERLERNVAALGEIERIKAACPRELGAAETYRTLAAHALNYGPSFQVIRRLWAGENEALAQVALDDALAADSDKHGMHPVLLDGCLQALCALAMVRGIGSSVIVPAAVARYRLLRPGERSVWTHVRLDAGLRGHVRILAQDGSLVAEIDAVDLHAVEDERPAVQGLLHETVWRELDASVPSAADERVWLVAGTDEPIVAALSQRAEVERDLSSALARARESKRPLEIVYLGGLSLDAAEPALSGYYLRVVAELLGVIKQLIAEGYPEGAVSLSVVTRGATGGNLAQAPLIGLVRCLANERPDLQPRLIDLDPDAPHDPLAVIRELFAADREDELALRGTRRLAGRIAPASEPSAVRAPAIEPDAAYLITGGLGGLGLELARWLAEHGAKKIVLASRRGAAAEPQLADIERLGARVWILRADVGDAGQVHALLERIASDVGPLRGVFHLAMILEDGLIEHQSVEQFERTLRAKADGAFHLHCATRALPLDHFVLYSSVASVLGLPGQSSYSAANAFLDALAEERRRQGLPAIAINWGPFSEVGSAIANAQRADRLETRGLASITPAQSHDMLAALLASGVSRMTVAPFEPKRWAEFFPHAARAPRFRELLGGSQPPAAGQSLSDRLVQLDAAERAALLEDLVADQAALVLRMPKEDIDCLAPLQTQGLDSLLSLELRNRLGASLQMSIGATTLWSHSSVRALARFLAQHVQGDTRPKTQRDGTNPANLDESLYVPRWIAAPASAAEANLRGQTWLVLADSRCGVAASLVALLEARGAACVVASSDLARAGDPIATRALIVAEASSRRDASLAGVVDLRPLDAAAGADLHEAQTYGALAAADVAQALEQAGMRDQQLWIVTAGAQRTNASEAIELAQAPVWGFAEVLRRELPALRTHTVDLSALSDRAALERELCALVADLACDRAEDQIAYRAGDRYVLRLARARDVQEQPAVSYRLGSRSAGLLDNLVLHDADRPLPGEGEVEIEVSAAALNFMDVMRAMGIQPGMGTGALQFGLECAGRISALGPNVEGLYVGQRVVAMGDTQRGCLARFVVTRASLVCACPETLSDEQAAAIPAVFLTAEYAMNYIGRLSAGERVLIHSAAGGVGLAAIQVARRAGAEIFATAGNPEKRAFLEALGIEHVFDSRSMAFAEEIMRATHGEGIDMVLNSLTGEAIPQSLGLLRDDGRFLEIGKRDIYEDMRLGLSPFKRGLSFSHIDIARLVRERPERMGAMLRDVLAQFERGELAPLEHTAFPAAEARDAFRYMAQAKHIGKIVVNAFDAADVSSAVVRANDTPIVSADATYLVTGGDRPLSLAAAEWLVEKGARRLVLIGPAAPSQAALVLLERLRGTGAELTVRTCQLARGEQLQQLQRELGSAVRGIIHVPSAVPDALVRDLDLGRCASELSVPMQEAWNVHRLGASLSLDFFVVCSSATALLGAAGKSEHAAVHAFLTALAQYRSARGRTSLSIGWNPGPTELSDRETIAVLDRSIGGRQTHVCVLPAADLRKAHRAAILEGVLGADRNEAAPKVQKRNKRTTARSEDALQQIRKALASLEAAK